MTLSARYAYSRYTSPIINLCRIQATTAYDLKKAWPESTLHIVPDAGHSSREPGIAKLLVSVRNCLKISSINTDSVLIKATDKFADL